MRVLILILVIALIGFLAYNYLYSPLSEEEKQVKEIAKKFDAAVEQYVRAVRTTAEIAMATVSDADEAIRKVKDAKKELEELRKGLKDKEAIRKAARLEERIKEFYRKNDLLD
jgi:erythromycin esterase-like protein